MCGITFHVRPRARCDFLWFETILVRGQAMPVKTGVAAPASTSSQRLTPKPARKGLAFNCPCTGPVGTGRGVVCVENRNRGQKRTKMK